MIDLRSSESNPHGHEVKQMRRYSKYVGRRRRARRQGRGSRAMAILSGILLAGTVACESLLEVEIPGQVEDAALDDPALAGTMMISALGEFECALNTLVPTNAFLTGEFIASNFFLSSNVWGWRGETEIRATSGACSTSRAATNYGYYTPFQRARFLAEDAVRRITEFSDADVPDKSNVLGTLNAYAGYSLVHLGENYCEMALDNGPLMQPREVLALAADRFTTAMSQASDPSIVNMARVGRARANLDLGNLSEAAADAEQVPEGFVRNAEYSTAQIRRENSTYNRTETDYLSVGFAWRDLTVGGMPDPRVPVVNTGRKGQDGETDQWDQLKYTSRDDPIPIASWREAQFIIAEARMGQAALDALNRVRDVYGIPHIQMSEVDDMLATILEERKRTFFLEGHWHSDMIRHNIQFPQGVNHKGNSFQPYSCMPLPDIEVNNNVNLSG